MLVAKECRWQGEVYKRQVREGPHNVRKVPHSVRKVPHSVRKVPHSVRKVPHSLSEGFNSVRKAPHSIRESHILTFESKRNLSMPFAVLYLKYNSIVC